MSAQILLQNAAAPGTPAAGYSSIYTKVDGKPYYKGPDGVEHALAGVTYPSVAVNGTTGAINAGGTGIASVVRNSAGNYTVTLSAPTSNTLPVVQCQGSSARTVTNSPGAPPYTVITVYTWNAAGVATDADFFLFMVPF